MATYKVIQDIEAEDKILGPLTLRQFIYAGATVLLLYLSWLCIAKGATIFVILFLPPAAGFAFFAFPFGKDQPTEVWALAKVNYLFRTRKRIWSQEGLRELVTVTVPKREEPVLTDGLSQTEVHSRLSALANTLDSRGWAVKNININMGAAQNFSTSDRIVDINTFAPRQVPDDDILAADDILDENSNVAAENMSRELDNATRAHRKQLLDIMRSGGIADTSIQPVTAADATGNAEWFSSAQVREPVPVTTQTNVGLPTTPVIPVGPTSAAPTPVPVQAVTPVIAQPAVEQQKSPDPVIMSLVGRGNDFTVSTLGREAKRAKGELDDEVIIDLH